MKRKAKLIDDWKKHTMKIIKARFGDTVNMQKVDAYLDEMIEREIKVPSAYIVNNYKQRTVAADLLIVTESIADRNLIVGGASTLFCQHDDMPNPVRDFILTQRVKRKTEKKTRDTYERGTESWAVWDIKQLNTKILQNSLYGVLGYAKFILHNIFLAESITRMGRVIISVAANGFENFLCDNIKFTTSSEVFEYIRTIMDEYEDLYKGKLDFSVLSTTVSTEDVYDRILKKCAFSPSMNAQAHLMTIINRLSDDERLLLFYKNNLLEFNRIPCIKEKLHFIFDGIEELKLPSIDKIENEDVRKEVEDLWKFYDIFVFWNHPVYDTVRKMAYGTREAVLYIDTDSNFIALNRWVRQIEDEVFEGNFHQDPKEFVFICANIVTIFLTTVVDRNLKMFAANSGISQKWAEFLSMKNEYFFWRILFGEVKKRYIDLQMIQEGKLLKDGVGIPEIKGYDLQKSTTKEILKDYYTDLCMKQILTPDSIDLKKIILDIDALKREIRRSMQAGESKYFKQANVNPPEHYAAPLRISGIKAVMLWNALCPEYAIELPSDVDIIPIKNIATEKYGAWFKEKYPEVYARFEREILMNRNPAIAKMACNVIAKPKNANVPMPDWLADIMNTEKIVTSTIKLIAPIMESLGLRVQRPTASKEYLTNIVDL